MDAQRLDYNPIPPQNLDAERAVLGALLQDQEAVVTAMETLKAEDFYDPRHQAVFEAISRVNQLSRGVKRILSSSSIMISG